MKVSIINISVCLAFGIAASNAKDVTATNDADGYGPHVTVKADMQETVDKWFKGSPTNGLV